MIKVRLKTEQCALEGLQLLCLAVLQSLLHHLVGREQAIHYKHLMRRAN